jgi:hypothetical protein
MRSLSALLAEAVQGPPLCLAVALGCFCVAKQQVWE